MRSRLHPTPETPYTQVRYCPLEADNVSLSNLKAMQYSVKYASLFVANTTEINALFGCATRLIARCPDNRAFLHQLLYLYTSQTLWMEGPHSRVGRFRLDLCCYYMYPTDHRAADAEGNY